MNRNVLFFVIGMVVVASCKKNAPDSSAPAFDSSSRVSLDSIPHADGKFPVGDELKSLLKSPTLVAMIDCPIDELSSDGNNGDLKKPDCLDTMISSRRESVIHMDSSVTPVFLPSLLLDNRIFDNRYYVDATVADDTGSLRGRVQIPYEIFPYGEEWKFRTSIWLTKNEAMELVNRLPEIKTLSGIYSHEANGGVILAACRNAFDSTRIANLCRKQNIRIKFTRIQYSRDDIFDLINDVNSEAEE